MGKEDLKTGDATSVRSYMKKVSDVFQMFLGCSFFVFGRIHVLNLCFDTLGE